MSHIRQKKILAIHAALGTSAVNYSEFSQNTTILHYLLRNGIEHLIIVDRCEEARALISKLHFLISCQKSYNTYAPIFRLLTAVGINNPAEVYSIEALDMIHTSTDRADFQFVFEFLEISLQLQWNIHIIQIAIALADRLKRIFGDANEDTIHAKNKIGYILFRNKKYNQSLSILQPNFTLAEKELGRLHPQTLLAINNLILTRELLGQYEISLQLSLDWKERYEEAYGKNSHRIAFCDYLIGTSLYKMQRYTESKNYLEAAYLRHKKHEKSVLNIVISGNWWVRSLLASKDFHLAVSIAQDVYKLGVQKIGKQFPEVQKSLELLHDAQEQNQIQP